jgi:hypothetical protein
MLRRFFSKVANETPATSGRIADDAMKFHADERSSPASGIDSVLGINGHLLDESQPLNPLESTSPDSHETLSLLTERTPTGMCLVCI